MYSENLFRDYWYLRILEHHEWNFINLCGWNELIIECNVFNLEEMPLHYTLQLTLELIIKTQGYILHFFEFTEAIFKLKRVL